MKKSTAVIESQEASKNQGNPEAPKAKHGGLPEPSPADGVVLVFRIMVPIGQIAPGSNQTAVRQLEFETEVPGSEPGEPIEDIAPLISLR